MISLSTNLEEVYQTISAGIPGFEPGKAVLETAVIPFHHIPIALLYLEILLESMK